MIEHELVVALSSTTFLDREGGVHSFPTSLSVAEFGQMEVVPLPVLGIHRLGSPLSHHTFPPLASGGIRLDTFLADAWAVDRLGGVPDILLVHPGFLEDMGAELTEALQLLAPKVKLAARPNRGPTDNELKTVAHVLPVSDEDSDSADSMEDFLERGNRRELLNTELAFIAFSDQVSLEIGLPPQEGTRRMPVYLNEEPFFKTGPGRDSWVVGPEANSAELSAQHDIERIENEQGFLSFVEKLRAAVACLSWRDTDDFKWYVDDYGLGDILRGERTASIAEDEENVESMQAVLQGSTVYFPANEGDLLSVIMVVTHAYEKLDAIAELKAKGGGNNKFRLIISFQGDLEPQTTLYCLPANTNLGALELEKWDAFVGACKIPTEALAAINALLQVPMTRAIAQQTARLIDSFLQDDPSWPAVIEFND